ncbi:MAG: DUF2958 domain-containing protein [Rhodospirillales bacterium]|nr:MAG: DUF2958 domain-containing protein [Rhodospirillales bacterium]
MAVGFCDLDCGCPELGSASTGELEGIRLLSDALVLKRGLHWKTNKVSSDDADDAQRVGRIGAALATWEARSRRGSCCRCVTTYSGRLAPGNGRARALSICRTKPTYPCSRHRDRNRAWGFYRRALSTARCGPAG